MQKFRFQHLFLPFVLACFISCAKDSKTEPIDSKIFINFHKKSGEVFLKAQTEKAYPCLGYKISYDKNISNKNIFIHFKKVLPQDPCLTAPGPATCEIVFDDLEDGEYSLKFTLNDQITEGILYIEDDIMVASIDEGGNVKLQ